VNFESVILDGVDETFEVSATVGTMGIVLGGGREDVYSSH
jgi:hypothetical protein